MIWLVAGFILQQTVPKEAFRFGNTQNDYMVLQQKPYRAQIWGFTSSTTDIITVSLSYQSNSGLIETSAATVSSSLNNSIIWKAYFSPRAAANDVEYIVTANSKISNLNISLSHILFGDVFICSGQSNMVFTVDSAFNSSQSLQQANNYPNIRLYTIWEQVSNSTELEIQYIEQNWSIASNRSIGNGNWTYFSAVCWFYAMNLYDYLNYPLGLISTAYGGTPIRAWMSPEARFNCNVSNINCPPPNDPLNNFTDVPDSSLWNAMIYPFLQTTIKGAIWYQGERDSRETYCAKQYHCSIVTMIESWRKYWHLYSDTDAMFPFGYVQLSTFYDTSMNEACSSPSQQNVDIDNCTCIGDVRWGQSGNYGYVPNEKMVNTFMAGSIDLGDPTSPWGDVHPRYKQDVGKRLANAAKNVIYGESDIYFQGPISEKFVLDKNENMAIINFRNVGEMGLEIRNYQGFEFCCIGDSDDKWVTLVNATFVTDGNYNITIKIDTNMMDMNDIKMVRFLWFHAPCYPDVAPYNCPIYDKQYQLPALPFIMNLTSN